MLNPALLHQIRSTLFRLLPTAEIILFGSQARGDATLNSDIDLLILVDNGKDTVSYHEKEMIFDSLFDLEMENGIEINPVIRTRKQWLNIPFRTPFYINVMNEGIKL